MDRPSPPAWLSRAALDWVVPLVILGMGIVDVAAHPSSEEYPGAPWRHVAFLVAGTALLGVRRRAPLLAPLLVLVVTTWWTGLWPEQSQGPFEGFLLLIGAAYSLGSHRDPRSLRVGAAALGLWFVLGLAAGTVGGRAGDVLPIAMWLAVGFGMGYLVSRRTDQALRAVEANRILAGEQERLTARAIEEERTRIARELHDVVAHSLSVIVVQAVAERRSLDGLQTDLTSVDTAFASIERAGREALVDLRRLLGLLRRTDEPVALAPQPGLAQLEELVASVRDAGLAVELTLPGDRFTLAPGLDLTAYRIVQEALTNVLKHANAHCVRVAVGFTGHHLDLEVSDDGKAEEAIGLIDAGPGHGLIGMHERATVFGGTMTAGSTGSGWTVRARLPVPAGAAG